MIGIILLVMGGGLYFTSSSFGISAESEARCIQQVDAKYDGQPGSSLVEMFKKSVGWVAQMDAQVKGAQSAQERAKEISATNQKAVGLGMIGNFLIGLCLGMIGNFLIGLCFGIGQIMLIKGVIGLRKKDSTTV